MRPHQSQQKMFQSLIENANMGKTEDRHIQQVEIPHKHTRWKKKTDT